MREGWTYKKIGDFCDVKTGKLDANASDVNGTYPFFTCSKEPLRINSFSYDAECVLIAGNGDLNVKYYKGKFDAYQRTYILTIKKGITDISVHYLYLFFLLYVDVLRKNSIGGVIKYIKLGDITDAIIHIPPLSEQERIVSELDLLSSIIEKKKAQLKEYDQLAQSIFYDMFGDPIENPKGWEVKKLGEVCAIASSLIDPNQEPYCNQYHVSPANIKSGTGEIFGCNLAKDDMLISGKYTFDKGMILYSKIRPNLNKVAIAPFAGVCSADMYPLSVKYNVNNVYICQLLLREHFLEYASKESGRARMPKINRESLFAYEFPLPPLPLQQSFASKIEAIEKQKSLVQQSIVETQTMFDYTMDKYFG